MKNIRTILFDCDGTLLNSLGGGMDSFNIALEAAGTRPHTPDEIIKFFGRSADKIFFQLIGDKKKAMDAYEVYLQTELRLISRIKPHEGILELLNDLKTLGVKLGVVTGRHRRDLELLFTETKLHSYFDVLITDDLLFHSKPHPEGLKLAANKLNTDVSECFYVGDSSMDIKASRDAGVGSIAALWDPWINLEELTKEAPACVAHKPKDILTLINLN